MIPLAPAALWCEALAPDVCTGALDP